MGLSYSLSLLGAPSLVTETDGQLVATSCGYAVIEVSNEVLC
jgi:hypothetical protein